MRLDVHVIRLEGELDAAVRRLEEHFGMPKAAAERFLGSLPRVAKHQADPEEARAYRRVLTGLGAEVELRSAADALPSSSLLDDLPSLPVPAHGPQGATPSMQSFASSARLADAVPRAPGIPVDLVPNLDESGVPRGRVSEMMSSPAPEPQEVSLGANIDFRGLSSLPPLDSEPQHLRSGLSTTPAAERQAATGGEAPQAESGAASDAAGQRPRGWGTAGIAALALIAIGIAIGILMSQ